jgi:hypothetical protein
MLKYQIGALHKNNEQNKKNFGDEFINRIGDKSIVK